MKKLRFIAASLCIGILAACHPRADATQSMEPVDHFSGDTLDLVSIGGGPLPEWDGSPVPCESALTPLSERLVFIDDSTYRKTTILRPGCTKGRLSLDTLEIYSLYRVHGDTLTLYTGDGDEIFQWYNGRFSADSVVQVVIEPARAWRYSRRRMTRGAVR